MSMISEVDHSSNRPICTTTSAVDGMTVTTEGTTTAKSPLDSLTDAATATNTTDHSIPNDEDGISSNTDAVVKQQYELPQPTITLIAKYGKERITLTNLPTETTIGQIKEMIQQQTRILPIRQKFVGLSAKIGGTKGVVDELPISELAIKSSAATNQNHKSNASAPAVVNVPTITHQFILMGTPEEQIFIDPSQKDDLPDIIDDFDFDFNAGSDEWIQHRANDVNLKQFTAQTPIHIMNEPRQNKPLLVLDLDHTLLDFSSKSLLQQTRYSQQQQPPMNDDASTAAVVHPSRDADEIAERMKRPYMDEFLSQCYHHYDLVIWSQTSWRWLETKLIELGMISHPGYKFCFVLDKVRAFLFLDHPTSMFTVVSTKRDGTKVKHHVKPLQIIWSKFPDRWGTHNTVHIDDLSRNFALNLDNGLQCKAYHRKKKTNSVTTSTHGRRDRELVGLSQYLVQLVESGLTFHQVDFTQWSDVVSGKTTITVKKNPNGKK